MSRRVFAPGIGKLARITQLPTLMCIPHIEADGELVITWSEPTLPPARRDCAAGRSFTSTLLDDAERAVGRWPDQYVLPIGADRQWDPCTETWTDIADRHRPPPLRRGDPTAHA